MISVHVKITFGEFLQFGVKDMRGRLGLLKFLLATFALSAPSPAFAYLDPGTGALLIQGIVGGLAVVAVFWTRVKTFVLSLFFRRSGAVSPASSDATTASEEQQDVEKEAENKR